MSRSKRVGAFIGAVAVAAVGLTTVASPASAATVTQTFQCRTASFGAETVEAPVTLDVSITSPADTPLGSTGDISTVTVAPASGSAAPRSPEVPLTNVTVRLDVTLDVVVSTSSTPPLSAAATTTVLGSGPTSGAIASVPPGTAWNAPGPVQIGTSIPGGSIGDRRWFRPSVLTYTWLADGALGTTTCRPVDTSSPPAASSVDEPVYGLYPAAKAPFGSSTVVGQPIVTPVNSCVGPNCATNQQLDAPVDPGQLGMSQVSGNVLFPAVTLNGSTQFTASALNQLTVVDARGTNAPWSLTGSMTDFTKIGGSVPATSTIPATSVSWSPACAIVSAAPGSIQAAPAGGFVAGVGSVSGVPTTASRGLCSHEGSTGGGTWTADAGMVLAVPPGVEAGQYKATLFLTLA